MRCLLVGSGNIGQQHIRALRSVVQNVEVIALRSGRGGMIAPGLVDREVRDRSAALASNPDFAIVADPAPCRPESAAPLISANIPVFLEKPIACDAAGMTILQAAAASNRRVLVGYVLRHDPSLLKFRETLQAGVIGRLLTLQLETGQALGDWRPGRDPMQSISAKPETGGGVLFELSHEIDAARWLLGELEVTHAVAGTLGELKMTVEDTALVLLRSERGATVTVQIDMARGMPTRRYRAVGTQATLTWDAGDGSVRLEADGAARTIYQGPVDRAALFRKQMQHFLAVVNGETRPVCALEDGAKTLAAVLDARRMAGLAAAPA